MSNKPLSLNEIEESDKEFRILIGNNQDTISSDFSSKQIESLISQVVKLRIDLQISKEKNKQITEQYGSQLNALKEQANPDRIRKEIEAQYLPIISDLKSKVANLESQNEMLVRQIRNLEFEKMQKEEQTKIKKEKCPHSSVTHYLTVTRCNICGKKVKG